MHDCKMRLDPERFHAEMGVLLRRRLAYFVSFVLGLCLSLGPALVLVWLFSKWNSLVSAH